MANENLCWFCRENAAQEQFTVKKHFTTQNRVEGAVLDGCPQLMSKE